MKNLKLLLATFLAVYIAALGTAFGADKGYRTPEAAIEAYIAGVVAGDFDQILAATAVEKMSTEFDFVSYVDRLRVLPFIAPAPSTNPMFIAINKATFTQQIGHQVQFLTYSLLSTSKVVEGQTEMMDGAAGAQFASQVMPSHLAGLSIVRIAQPGASVASTPIHLQNLARQALIYGANEVADRVVLLAFGDANYLIGFTLLRYVDDWGVSSQNSALGNTSFSGGATLITPEAFEDLLQ
jgi:hypothetical protein